MKDAAPSDLLEGSVQPGPELPCVSRLERAGESVQGSGARGQRRRPAGGYGEGGRGTHKGKPLTPLRASQGFLPIPVGAGGVERRPEKPGSSSSYVPSNSCYRSKIYQTRSLFSSLEQTNSPDPSPAWGPVNRSPLKQAPREQSSAVR